jgi:hypothetical protein
LENVTENREAEVQQSNESSHDVANVRCLVLVPLGNLQSRG